MQKKKERVLLFISKQICYQSNSFFAGQLAVAFERLGFAADICELSWSEELEEKLEPLLGRKYRVILDFNSMLPRVVMDDETPYLDMLDGPFFNYVLDHPLFHHGALASGVRNMNALVLDEAQRDYVKRCYPGLAGVHMLPLGASKAFYEGKKATECRIFFSGSFDSMDTVYDIIKAAPEPLQSVMKQLAERRIAEPLLTMDEAAGLYLEEKGLELSPEKFALYVHSMYPVDIYVRNHFRKLALDELLSQGIPVTVMGDGWEKYHYRDEHSLQRRESVPFSLSFERIAREHVLLDVSPIFNRGMHDRVPAGMANRAVVLTDKNPYLEARFTDGKDICFYSLKDIHTLGSWAERLLGDENLRSGIAEHAFCRYEAHDTWLHRAKAILKLVP